MIELTCELWERIDNEIAYRNYKKRQRHCAAKVRRALKAGRLKKLPCEVCNDIKSVAHHPDYLEPLTILWLCRKHHAELHKYLRLDEAIKKEGI